MESVTLLSGCRQLDKGTIYNLNTDNSFKEVTEYRKKWKSSVVGTLEESRQKMSHKGERNVKDVLERGRRFWYRC
jgi:hypothetical protein